ncbi:hypothetical protein ACHAW5_002991 [Stephanodiscus triporus]|uniref:J domain-containing protein n=1 Tax=Stephanodiscus triporus TaxID=2934178 RepID=A0ABD3NEC1_9STRA
MVSVFILSGSVYPQGTDCIFTSDDVSVFATLSSANLADVRDEWERVKLSYEILSDPKTRKNYDRNSSVAEVLKDPGGAVGRAVVGGAMSGIGLVLGGAWKLGEMATKKVYETAVAEKEKGPTKKIVPSPEQVSNAPDTRSDSVVKTKDTNITPGTSGSVRYNYTSNPRSTPMPGITMRETIVDIPAPQIAMEATSNESTPDNATPPGSNNGIIEKDTGDIDINTITLLTPETNVKSAGAKKKRKLSQKGGKGFSKN